MYNKKTNDVTTEDYSFLYADINYATDTKKLCQTWKKEQEQRLKKYYKIKYLHR